MRRVLLFLLLLIVPGSLFAQGKPDFNKDGKIDFADFVLFAKVYGSANVIYDLDGDGTVGQGDFVLFAEAFNQPLSASKISATAEEIEAAAKAYWESGNYTGSIQKYEEFLAAVKDPDSKVMALMQIGLAYMEMDSLNAAGSTFRKIIKDYDKGLALGAILKDYLADCNLALAEVYFRQNNAAATIKHLDSISPLLSPYIIKK